MPFMITILSLIEGAIGGARLDPLYVTAIATGTIYYVFHARVCVIKVLNCYLNREAASTKLCTQHCNIPRCKL